MMKLFFIYFFIKLNYPNLSSNIPSPIVKQCDGDYQYEKYKNLLVWRIEMIDQSNSTGSLEFSVASGHSNEFFPVNVSFFSSKSYCDIQVKRKERILNHIFQQEFFFNLKYI